MRWAKKVKSHFQKEEKNLLEAIKSVKKIRDSALSPMESQSDRTREKNEKLTMALETELQKLRKSIAKIPSSFEKRLEKGSKVKEWQQLLILLDDERLKICLVPEGIGGEVIDEVRLVSSNSPLGNLLLKKKVGEEFIFKGQKGKVAKRK